MKENENQTTSVVQKPEQDLSNEVSRVEQAALSVEIIDETTYQAAGELLTEIKAQQKSVKDFFEPMRKSTYEAYQAVLSRKSSMDTPLGNAEKILKKKMGDYIQQEEKKRIAHEKAMKDAAKKASEEKFAEAVDAEANGDQAGAEFALAEAEIYDDMTAIVPATPAAPKAKGVSSSKTWKITSIDNSKVPDEVSGVLIRPVDEKAVLRLIKASGGQIKIPGVVYEQAVTISARGNKNRRLKS